MAKDDSKSRIIGNATKKSESGSGGLIAAERMNVPNQICLLRKITSSRFTKSVRIASSVSTGAWNPIAQATDKFRMNPMKPFKRHSVVKPAAWASFCK